MRLTVANNELAEVAIECYYHAPFPVRDRQNGGVAGVCRPFANPDDVVTRGPQFGAGAFPNTRVEQQPHPVSWTSLGS